MPKINLDKERVLKLTGNKIGDEELRKTLGFLGTDVESITKNEIEVEIFPNRPDLLSEEGLGRALKSFTGKEKGLKKYSARKSDYKVIIEKSVGSVRPHTACAVVKGLKLDEKKMEDIIEIQEKLHVTYGRNRKKCAIGVYPSENIDFPVSYKALPVEKIVFRPLDSKKEMGASQILKFHDKGKEYAHLLKGKKHYPLFVDGKGSIMSMPPIINSEETGKINKKTKDVFVECSGHDFRVLSKALNMVVTALSDMGGSVYEVELVNENRKTPELIPEEMYLDKEYAESLIGRSFSDNEIIGSLERMGFGASKKGKSFKVLIPCYRTDILHQADLVEDVAIGFGYNNVGEENERPETPGKEDFREELKEKIREIISGHGLVEARNYNLSNKDFQEKYFGRGRIVGIKNYLSEEYNSLRYNILVSLLKALKVNKHHDYPQSFFELGKVFSKDSSEESGVKEEEALGVVFCGVNANFNLAKQHLDSIFSLLGLKYELVEGKDVFMIKGRCGVVKFKGRNIGFLGEISPGVLVDYDLDVPVSGFEIVLDDLFGEF